MDKSMNDHVHAPAEVPGEVIDELQARSDRLSAREQANELRYVGRLALDAINARDEWQARMGCYNRALIDYTLRNDREALVTAGRRESWALREYRLAYFHAAQAADDAGLASRHPEDILAEIEALGLDLSGD